MGWGIAREYFIVIIGGYCPTALACPSPLPLYIGTCSEKFFLLALNVIFENTIKVENIFLANKIIKPFNTVIENSFYDKVP